MSWSFLFTPLWFRRKRTVSLVLILLALVILLLVDISHAQEDDENSSKAPSAAFSSAPSLGQSNAPSPANVTSIKESNAPSLAANEGTVEPSTSPVEVRPSSSFPTSFPIAIVVDDGEAASDVPSLVPTRASAAPTLTPGPTLTRRPSDSPSDVPSDVPSDMPSISLSTPTLQPTIVVTPNPSVGVTTTASPIPPPQGGGIPISVRFYGMSMILKGVGALSVEATEIWVNVTEDFYETVHNTEVLVGSSGATPASRQRQRFLQTLGIKDFSTVITYTTQSAATDDNESSSKNNTLAYYQEVSYSKTANSAPSAAALIQDPFKDEALNRFYVDTLRASNAAFSDLEYNVPLPTIPTPPAPSPNKSSNDDKSLSTAVIAGIVLGAVFLLALLFMACQYRSSNNNNNNNRRESTSGYDGDHNSGRRPPGDDESSSRIPDDDFHYDDQNKRKRPGTQRQPSPNENMFFDGNEEDSEQDSSNDTDDVGGAVHHRQQHSRRIREEDRDAPDFGPKLRDNEELLVIQAPAGWLGVVIDTPDQDSPPVVHDIKESSAIFDILQIGDRLIAVDEEDVTQMTATQVSKVISKKAANRVRLLRVIRTKHDEDSEIV